MRVALIFGGLLTNPKVKEKKVNKCYIKTCYSYYKKHLLDCNKSFDIDIYIHLWSNNINSKEEQEKKNLINKLYKPKKFLVESFEESNNFVSRFKSIQKGFNLIEEETYDLCFFSRLDIVIRCNLLFNKYNLKEIYHNDGMAKNGGHFGDFYFILNFKNSKHFSKLYDKIKNKGNEKFCDNTFRNEFLPNLKKHLLEIGKINNDLKAGSEVEVYWKLVKDKIWGKKRWHDLYLDQIST